MDESINVEEALITEWTTAVEALDFENIRELFDIRPELLWTPLTPLTHLETDFAHFIQRLEEHKLLGTSIRPVYALHHILYDFGVPNDEWSAERIELVDFILKNTKSNELNTCFWGSEQNSVMHLAYFTNQSELIQQLKDNGALSDIPNNSGYLPTIEREEGEAINISQPEVKLLINKSKSAALKDRPQTNASDRFKRLRELAESPNANNKPLTERQNSTRRYFRPGHLEERKRRVLSEEEEAELKKQDQKRQKEVEQLAQRSAVRNNPLFKKFEEQQQQQPQSKRAPSISAASAVRERKKLLVAADQIRRTSRVINSLKDRSYVSTSVFRQAQEAEDATRKVNKLTLAQLRAGNPAIKEVSPSTSDNEEDTVKQKKPVIAIEEKDDMIKTESKEEINKLEDKDNSGTTNNNINVTSKNVSDSILEDNKLTNNIKKDSTTTSNLNTKSNDTSVGVTEVELESLSIGKLGDRGLLSKSKTDDKKKFDIPSSKVKNIVNVHEHLNDEEEIKLHTLGKKFEVWKKDEVGQSEDKEYVAHGKKSSLEEASLKSTDSLVDNDNQPSITQKEALSKEKFTVNDEVTTNTDKGNSSSKFSTTSPKSTTLDNKSQLTPNSNNDTLTKDTKSRSIPTKDDQPLTTNTTNKVLSTANKIESSFDQNTTNVKNGDSAILISNASSSVSNLKAAFKDDDDLKDTKYQKPTSTLTKKENSNTSTEKQQHSIEQREMNDGSFATHSKKGSTTDLVNQIQNDVLSTFAFKDSTPNLTESNGSLQEKSQSSTKQADDASSYPTANHGSDSTSSLNSSSYSNLSTSSKEILNSTDKYSFTGKEDISDSNSRVPKSNSENLLSKKDNIKRTGAEPSNDALYVVHSDNELNYSTSNIKQQPSISSSSTLDDTSDSLLSSKTPIDLKDQTNTEINNNKAQPISAIAENETSPIPAATNHLESNHDNFTTDRSIKIFGTSIEAKNTSSNHTTTSIESKDMPEFSSTDDNDYSDFEDVDSRSVNQSNSATTSTNNPNDIHTESKENTSTYLNTNTSNQVEEKASRIHHLEINTNRGQLVIEEESDEDEASTPTMANPHTYQQKKKAIDDQSDDDEESRQEWQSAYHTLMTNQQEMDFEDDVLTHHNKTIAKGKDDTTRQSISSDMSDMDETSIIQTLSYQNEARVDNWASKQEQSKKRQSGSQRNHWSTGIQHVDIMKRASLMSRGGESIAASSEAGSEQWFDPDEEWNEQQEEIRRQSMLPTANSNTSPIEDYSADYYYNGHQEETYRHSDSSTNTSSEAYSYKNSNSTENTNLDEEEEEERKRYQQEIEEEEEDDYYSTNLHASSQDKTRGQSSYYNGGQSDNDQDEEGEIVVFMNQFSPSSLVGEANKTFTRDIQKNSVSQEPSENTTTKFLNNSSTQSLVQSQTPKPLTATITNFSSSTLSVNNIRREDDEISLIKVPSRTIDIADAGKEQEILPHDPNNPRVEDISHYMNKLPAFERNQNGEAALRGGSAFDAAAMEGGGGLENETVVIKRAISTAHPDGMPAELDRGIPNAHEIDSAFIKAEKGRMSHEGGQKMSMGSMEANSFGKMYIGVSGAHYMLLPLPKEITYVRCVISDGEYEYMSRYEILGHQILMDYECVIDTRPGMIITVSLHVRPDYHVKPRTGWTKWFTSIRKQKEHLSGYVHPEDGAIGQTRFAVDHMVPGCYKKTYEAHFDCFNSWYARTTRERARREQFGDEEDFLKIVGKLNVEMLYLPVSNPSVQVPRSLRECDLTLKIRQWHDTCWQSGYLSTRRQGLKIWERHYYRLIGSQLVGYTSDGSDKQVWDHYNMSDVIRLSAAADKVIVTLLEDQNDEKIFGSEPIHAENHKGFFRLAFPDYHLDCVSDDVEESEEWVKTLKSMIGRIPLRLPFSD